MTLATAKVFTTGNSQAVRLPKAFRVQAREMWISRNEATGEITLRPKGDDRRHGEIKALMQLLRELPPSEDWLPPRDDPPRPDPFEDWPEEPPTPLTTAPRKGRQRTSAAK